jgi:CRISPR-associated protein Cmr2
MTNFENKLKSFLHDPIDKCFDIRSHVSRAKKYAESLGVKNIEDAVGADVVASCMERSLLPKEIIQEFNEIRHPLSFGKREITIKYNKKDIFSDIEKIFNQIADEIYGFDERKKLLFLWRNLQDKVFNGISEKNKELAKILSVLPADTRIPDHSIWEHLKMASAIEAFWDSENQQILQNNTLFLFSIGPVQSFIVQARKTQDFYLGSYMLSYLTFVAMENVINDFGPTSIIFPDLYKQSLADWFLKKEFNLEIENFDENSLFIPSIPNRFVAIIPETNREEIKKIAQRLKDKITDEINKIKQSIIDQFEIKLDSEQEKIFDNHFKNFPQIYWTALPWKIDQRDIVLDDLKDFIDRNVIEEFKKLIYFAKNNGEFKPNIGFLYQIIYTALEKQLGARKNLREFEQDAEAGVKCSLCGERNVLFFREDNNPRKFLRFNPQAKNLKKNLKNIPLKYLANGEGLCGVCFVKRCFDVYLKEKVSKIFNNLSFPSTSEIATANFKRIAFENAKDEFKSFEAEFNSTGVSQLVSPVPKLKNILEKTVEGHWFFEENLRKEELEKAELSFDENKLKQLRKNLKELTEKIGKPSSYYAVISLDGDNMGKWLSGELLPDIEDAYNSKVWAKLPENFKKELKTVRSKKILTPAVHASISTVLRNYALEFVRMIVEEEHLGKLVYAGGDDVLAFVNLEDLFDVMVKLRAAFSGHIIVDKNGNLKVDWKSKNGFVEKQGKLLLIMGPLASASMGVVIAHYKAPLQLVLKKAHNALEKAKDEEKDSFCLVLIKRSGGERISKLKWIYEDNDKFIDTIQYVKEISKKLNSKEEKKDGYFSDGFIYKIKEEFSKLVQPAGILLVDPTLFEKELYRLLLRSYNGNKKDVEKKKFTKEFSEILSELYRKIGDNVNNFLDLLIIISFVTMEIERIKE